MGELGVTVEDKQRICNYFDFYILRRDIDRLGIPRKAYRHGTSAFASNASDGLRLSFQTDGDALLLVEVQELAAAIRDTPDPHMGSSFPERCEYIDYAEDQAGVKLYGEQMILGVGRRAEFHVVYSNKATVRLNRKAIYAR